MDEALKSRCFAPWVDDFIQATKPENLARIKHLKICNGSSARGDARSYQQLSSGIAVDVSGDKQTREMVTFLGDKPTYDDGDDDFDLSDDEEYDCQKKDRNAAREVVLQWAETVASREGPMILQRDDVAALHDMLRVLYQDEESPT